MRKKWGKWGNFNVQRAKTSFEKKISKNSQTGCWNWIAAKHSSKKYGIVGFAGLGPQLAHRVSWMIFRGEDPAEMFVCHKCDNGLCVNPSHLFLGTATDNMRDMENKGRSRHPRCEKHGRAKLTTKDVEKIRQLHANGMAIRAVARKFTKVSRTNIRAVIRKETWITT